MHSLWKSYIPQEAAFCLNTHFMCSRKGQSLSQKAEQGTPKDNRQEIFIQRVELGCNQGSSSTFHYIIAPGAQSPYFIFKIGKLIMMILLLPHLCLLYKLRVNYLPFWFICSSATASSNGVKKLDGNTLDLHQRKNENILYVERMMKLLFDEQRDKLWQRLVAQKKYHFPCANKVPCF